MGWTPAWPPHAIGNPLPLPTMGQGLSHWLRTRCSPCRNSGPFRPSPHPLELPQDGSRVRLGLLPERLYSLNRYWLVPGSLPFFCRGPVLKLCSPRCQEGTRSTVRLCMLARGASLERNLLDLETWCRKECSWGQGAKLVAIRCCERTPQNIGSCSDPKLQQN